LSPWALNRLIHALARGAVFGYPSDTIWGLGCHPLIAGSVERILQIKRRPISKGLILLSSRLEYCRAYLGVDTAKLVPIARAGEQPTTWLVPASEFCPPWLRGEHPTIAIRITDHPLLQRLCDGIEAPVVSTSANRSGRSSARSRLQMQRQFGDELDFIVGGFTPGTGRPSEIKSLLDGATVRTSKR